jgi:hypothetical protein
MLHIRESNVNILKRQDSMTPTSGAKITEGWEAHREELKAANAELKTDYNLVREPQPTPQTASYDEQNLRHIGSYAQNVNKPETPGISILFYVLGWLMVAAGVIAVIAAINDSPSSASTEAAYGIGTIIMSLFVFACGAALAKL